MYISTQIGRMARTKSADAAGLCRSNLSKPGQMDLTRSARACACACSIAEEETSAFCILTSIRSLLGRTDVQLIM